MLLKIKSSLWVFILASLIVLPAQAKFKWSELRIFATSNQFDHAQNQLNLLTTADNVRTFKTYSGIGIEADAQVLSWLKVGTRYNGSWSKVTEPYAPSPAPAFIAIQQSAAGMLVRVPLVQQNWIQFDVFGELGLANTHIDVQTSSSGGGTFTQNAGFYQRAGASLGIGWKSFKIYVEAGQEWNRMSNPSYSGTLSTGINSIDLGGPFYAAGFIISGVPSWIKPGGVSTQ